MAVAVTPSILFNSAVVAVKPSTRFISVAVAVTPSILFNSDAVAVIPNPDKDALGGSAQDRSPREVYLKNLLFCGVPAPKCTASMDPST